MSNSNTFRKLSGLLLALLCMCVALKAQSPVTLKSVEGESVTPGNGGKVTVLAFGATWVPLSSKELPALQKLADRYQGRSVEFYWVSVNSLKSGAKSYASDADLKAFAAKYNVRMTVLRDPDQAAYRSFGLDSLPSLVILDGAGKVSHKHVGFDPDQTDGYGEVSRALDKLLK
jgi:peroxiredoxin